MVYSASAIVAADRFDDPYFFLKKQLFWALLGAAACGPALRSTTAGSSGSWCPLLIVSVALLVLVLVPPFGQAINGTRRWIRLGPVSFQPAELAKLALVALPGRLPRHARQEALARLPARVCCRSLAGGGRLAALILRAAGPRQLPDAASSLTFGARSTSRAPACSTWPWSRRRRCRWWSLAICAAPYRVRRMIAFVDPVGRSAGQRLPDHPVVARPRLGRPRSAGASATRSRSSSTCRSRTPTSSSPIIGEELGFIGATAIVALFAVLIWRGLRIGLRAPDAFGAYLALGHHRAARHPDAREPGRGDGRCCRPRGCRCRSSPSAAPRSS